MPGMSAHRLGRLLIGRCVVQRFRFRDKVAATHKHAFIPATDKAGNMEESETHRKLAFFRAMEAKNAKSSAGARTPTHQLTVV